SIIGQEFCDELFREFLFLPRICFRKHNVNASAVDVGIFLRYDPTWTKHCGLCRTQLLDAAHPLNTIRNNREKKGFGWRLISERLGQEKQALETRLLKRVGILDCQLALDIR